MKNGGENKSVAFIILVSVYIYIQVYIYIYIYIYIHYIAKSIGSPPSNVQV